MPSNQQALESRDWFSCRLLAGMAITQHQKNIKSGFLALVFLLVTSSLFAAEALKSTDCLDCHTDPANKRMVNGHAVAMALFPTNGFAKSVHSGLDCVDCHDGIKEMMHDKNVPPPNCAGCHEQEQKDYATSIHGMSHNMGASGAAQCWDCHGSHEILPVKNTASPVYKMNLPATCAKCHSNTNLTKEYQIQIRRGGGGIHGQHPRHRAVENGIDRRAVLR